MDLGLSKELVGGNFGKLKENIKTDHLPHENWVSSNP